jgi:hypothetical protein
MSVGTNPSRLAQTLAQAAVTAAPSALWKQLVAPVPGLQNAAHFYLQDAQKLTRLALNAAGAPIAVDDEEVHYHAHPETSTVPLRGAELQLLPGGEVLLLLLVPGGFAVFEVLEDGVVEVTADLAAEAKSGPVVCVRAISKTLLVVLHERLVRLFDGSSGAFLDGPGSSYSLESVASRLFLMRRNCVVCCPEFQQLLVLELPSYNSAARTCHGEFILRNALVNDGSVDTHTVAVSARWIAYCSQFERAPTVFSAKASAESALSAVARTVSGRIKLVCGITPGLAPQNDPSSAVTVFDVEAGVNVASFSPHNCNIQCMAFDPSGTLLATASSDGTTVNVFQVGRSSGGEGAVTLLCRLARGMTPQTITALAFSPQSNYIGVATTVGTCHIFRLGDVVTSARGVAAPQDFSAPLLSTPLRVRACPTTMPVNPSLVFPPTFSLASPTVVLVSASGVVSVVSACGKGCNAVETVESTPRPRLVYSKFLDAFEARREPWAADGHEHRDAFKDLADVWRVQVELTTAPAVQSLDNFRIPGLPQHSAETAGEWEPV